jgi:hypothetical protein
MRARASESLLSEDMWVSSFSHARMWGSQRMILAGCKVGMVLARAVVTARRMACV